MSAFRPPIMSSLVDGQRMWTLNLGEDEREVVAHLLGELRALLQATDEPGATTSPLLQRLFPPAYPDDAEKEDEYQRLMREELVASRLHQINAIDAAIQGDSSDAPLDEGQVIALMQSINAVRVVLGTMLDVGEDDVILADTDDEEDDDHDDVYERRLYEFLSWLLDWIVRSLPA